VVGTAGEILPQADVRELREINEFSSAYHHSTNPEGFATAPINDAQLTSFARRTVVFSGL
jgi:hypothetical protein